MEITQIVNSMASLIYLFKILYTRAILSVKLVFKGPCSYNKNPNISTFTNI